MDSVKMAEFLFARIQQTIAKRQYIKEVEISYSVGESYGNSYLYLTYQLEANEKFLELPLLDQETMFEGNSHYVYSISTNTHSNYWEEITRVVAFRNIYESITAYAILQLEGNLLPNTPIRVESINLWPNANYAEKYMHQLLSMQYFRPNIREMNEGIGQWKSLHQLALKSKKKLLGEKCLVSDLEISENYGFSVSNIRWFVIFHQTPIKVKGVEIISEIQISVPALLQALKMNNSQHGYGLNFPGLINNLYDDYLPKEKAIILQGKRASFLQDFIIQSGDLVILNSKRIVQATVIDIDTDYRIWVTYTILKNNMQPSDRTRTVDISEISSVLKSVDFQEYLRNNSIYHLMLLKRWMEKRVIAIDRPAFNIDLRE
ncbi:hypothetical protein HHL17_07030 [Chitinophaga sp. G-6-1-13]|uniref:Uncharacterized protein n=1 Tax=Chitinophaga fulva TaxID=2728842 RepID=A0A848GLW5_9BACT|nr:hypothetical protein [Chitinophaga fulva]NML36948.1 hypothetical protein [Chitinophaga fulva]